MKITMKWPLMAALCVIGFGSMVSCDDDDKPVTPPTILDFKGDYAGTMKSTVETTEVGSSNVEFKVDADTIRFASLPVKPLIEAVLGEGAAEGAADDIITALGDVKYNVGYSFAAKTDASSAELTLAPKALVLSFTYNELPMVVNVTIASKTKGAYTTATKNLKFNLEVTGISVGDQAQPDFKEISIAFDATRK